MDYGVSLDTGLTLGPIIGSAPAGAGMATAVTTDPTQTAGPLWAPSNPMLWIGLMLAASVGLAGFAGRVGPASVQVGKA